MVGWTTACGYLENAEFWGTAAGVYNYTHIRPGFIRLFCNREKYIWKRHDAVDFLSSKCHFGLYE